MFKLNIEYKFFIIIISIAWKTKKNKQIACRILFGRSMAQMILVHRKCVFMKPWPRLDAPTFSFIDESTQRMPKLKSNNNNESTHYTLSLYYRIWIIIIRFFLFKFRRTPILNFLLNSISSLQNALILRKKYFYRKLTNTHRNTLTFDLISMISLSRRGWMIFLDILWSYGI